MTRLDRLRLDGPPRWGALLGALCVSLGVGLVGVSDRLDRLARGPEAAGGFALATPSGLPAVARGEPVTLAALATPSRPGGPLPAEAWLLTRRGRDERARPMAPAGGGAFTATVPGPETLAGFEYAVRAGFAQSAWRAVRVGEPVKLTACGIVVRPPTYAATLAERRLASWQDLEALAGSHAELELAFDPAPVDVRLTLAGPTGNAPVAVALDGAVARAAFPLPPSATLTLVATAAAGLETRQQLAIRTTPDAPPTLALMGGFPPREFAARPNDVLRLRFRAADDAGPVAVTLEVEGAAPRPAPVVDGGGEVDVAITKLTRFRLVARERSPEARAATLPAVGYFEAAPDGDAEPLAERAIRAEAADWSRRAGATHADLLAARAELRRALGDPDGGPITPEANAGLQSAATRLRDICEPARKLVLSAAEADDGRHALIQAALERVRPREAELAAQLAGRPRLSGLRLDALALRRLADEAAPGRLSGPDATTRLAGLVATRAGLGESVALAEARSDAESRALLEAVRLELDAFERVASAWPTRRRVHAAAGPRAAQWLLLRRAIELATSAARPGRLAGAPRLEVAAFALARDRLVAGDLLEAAVAQETAAVAAERLASRVEAAAAARVDRRETLAQLARWRTECDARGPAPGELAALRRVADVLSPTLPIDAAGLADASRREPPRAERLKLAVARVGELRAALSRAATPSLAGELARLDARAWPASPEAAVLALDRAARTRHPGDALFAADALARLAGTLTAGDSPGRGVGVKAIADAARPLSPASAERVSLLASAGGPELAAALELLARRQSGDEAPAEADARLTAWASEAPKDPRWTRLVAQERALTPPGGFARLVGPPRPSDADILPTLGYGYLPHAADAAQFRRLADDQRHVRDRTAAALAASNRPPATPAADPMAASALALAARAESAPPAERARLQALARCCRAGDRAGILALVLPGDSVDAGCWDLAEETARVTRRGRELARDAERLAAAIAGPARELAAEAARLIDLSAARTLTEAGFRLDAARAHLPPVSTRGLKLGDADLAAAGAALKRVLALSAATAPELRQVADRLERAATQGESSAASPQS